MKLTTERVCVCILLMERKYTAVVKSGGGRWWVDVGSCDSEMHVVANLLHEVCTNQQPEPWYMFV